LSVWEALSCTVRPSFFINDRDNLFLDHVTIRRSTDMRSSAT
jgi:hypothetical protein